jgi:hypothetical protein
VQPATTNVARAAIGTRPVDASDRYRIVITSDDSLENGPVVAKNASNTQAALRT